ncbi:MAG: hypothetical protein KAT68_09630 [Bacteroidales bacterium]|nr:hypothetical protein [Bacteroidales bacterium]
MIDYENIFDKLKQISGKEFANINILEEQIDISLQMEYFELSKEIKKDINKEEIISKKDNLFNTDIAIEEKKKLLIQLASIEDVKAYRTIEKYLSNPAKELKNWAILAFQESRMILQSSLLDENQVFISTGLGGKGTKLRYFIVIISNSSNSFTVVQKKIINSEFDFILKKRNGELEKIEFSDNISTILSLIPINVSVQEVFKNAIEECNKFGNFLKPDFLITNVKVLTTKEIKTFLEKPKNSNVDIDTIELN